METFLPAYLQAFGEYVADLIPPDHFIQELLKSTRFMVDNQQPDQTLRSVFENNFFSTFHSRQDQIKNRLETFYFDIFPNLKGLTHFWPEAKELVDTAVSRGYRLAIATNPLFPRTAIEQRLTWAGLPPDAYPFEIIASYETFHFAKPHTAFFAEILSQMGWPDGPILMVGDDRINDIYGAGCLELATFWITNLPPPPTESAFHIHGSGALDQLIPWIDATPLDALKPAFETPAALMGILNATLAGIIHLVSRLPQAQWAQRPSKTEWSVTETLCHLRDVETEVHYPRINEVLTQDNPFLPGKDTDAWAEQGQYFTQDGGKALEDFIKHRKRTINRLSGLLPGSWRRPARHTIFGPTDLQELVKIIAGHDRLHIRQIHQILESVEPGI